VLDIDEAKIEYESAIKRREQALCNLLLLPFNTKLNLTSTLPAVTTLSESDKKQALENQNTLLEQQQKFIAVKEKLIVEIVKE